MSNLITVCGNPNAGKSTVFNALTNGNARVGNWHGVTIEKEINTANIGGKIYTVEDLPGFYSLTPVTLEEKIAVNGALSSNGIILYIIEAVTFLSSIKTALELIKRKKKVIVAVNMIKELKKRGGNLNVEKLKSILPCPVVVGEFNSKKGVEAIKTAISNYSSANYGERAVLEKDINNVFVLPSYKESALDKITLSKYGALPFFFVTVGVIFYLAFGNYGIGKPLSEWLEIVFQKLGDYLRNLLKNGGGSEFVVALVCEGVVGALGGVACFLPQTLVLMFALTMLELSGYMSRLAYVSENFFKNTGLNGRAVFSIFMGFGCTALSVVAAGGLENEKVKKKAALVSGMIPCSAKIPVIAYLSSFASNQFVFITAIYCIGMFFAILQLKLADKFFIKGSRLPLVLEIPPYRLPKLSLVLKSLKNNLKQFIIKICTVIFIISLAVFLLKSVTPSFTYSGGDFQKSILYYIGSFFSFITVPIGITDARITSALIAGLFAKEGVLSAMLTLFPNGINISLSSLFALTVFIYVYTPCIAAMFSVGAENGKNFAVKFGILQFVEAVLSAVLIYSVIEFTVISITAITLVIGAIALLKFTKRKNKNENF